MRRMLLFLFTVVMLVICLCAALAESADYQSMSLEELNALREEKYREMDLINQAIAEKNADVSIAADIDDGVTIADLFPDEVFALFVRDQLGKTSIRDSVTQDELDTFTSVYSDSYSKTNIGDLTGISHLRNVRYISIETESENILSEELLQLPHLESLRIGKYSCTSLPTWFTQLSSLRRVTFDWSKLTELPEDWGNMVNLTELSLWGAQNLYELPESLAKLTSLKELCLRYTNFETIPEWIGNMYSLEKLDLGYTKLTSLPDSIGNLVNLKTLDLEHSTIAELPETVISLHIPELIIKDTNIK